MWSLIEILEAGDFSDIRTRLVFDAMGTLAKADEPIDIITVKLQLARQNLLAEAGGDQFIIGLAETVPTAANVAYYARTVKDLAGLRRVHHAGEQIMRMVCDHSAPGPAGEEAYQLLQSAMTPEIGAQFVTIGEAADACYLAMEQAQRDRDEHRKLLAPSTGFHSIDAITQGLHPELHLIAARPSLGKTALSLAIAQAVAAQSCGTVAYFSLEMLAPALVQRVLSDKTSIPHAKLRTASLDSDEWQAINRARRLLHDLPLKIMDHQGMSPASIKLACLRLASQTPLAAIVIDYLQLMKMRGFGPKDREREVSEMSRQIKSLVKTFGVPVILLCQLNRELEKFKRPPQLSDLRESGSLEQDADTVHMLHREVNEPGIIFDHIAKQRNGETGIARLGWMGRFVRFVDEDQLPAPPADTRLRDGAGRVLTNGSQNWVAELIRRSVESGSARLSVLMKELELAAEPIHKGRMRDKEKLIKGLQRWGFGLSDGASGDPLVSPSA